MYLLALIKKGANAISLMGGIGEHIVPYLSQMTQSHLISAKKDAIEGALMMANNPQHNLYSFAC